MRMPILLIEEEPIRGVRAAVDALRSDQCRWPFNEVRGADFHFCSGDKVKGSAYCEMHRRLNKKPIFKAE